MSISVRQKSILPEILEAMDHLYTLRDSVEIKQLLHIKSFIGTSENAVMIQIWTAVITILVLKFLKEISKYGWQRSNLVAFIRPNLIVKIDLQKWLDKPFDEPISRVEIVSQGVLF